MSSSTTTPAWLLWASCFTGPGTAKAASRCSLWAPTLVWASWSTAGSTRARVVPRGKLAWSHCGSVRHATGRLSNKGGEGLTSAGRRTATSGSRRFTAGRHWQMPGAWLSPPPKRIAPFRCPGPSSWPPPETRWPGRSWAKRWRGGHLPLRRLAGYSTRASSFSAEGSPPTSDRTWTGYARSSPASCPVGLRVSKWPLSGLRPGSSGRPRRLALPLARPEVFDPWTTCTSVGLAWW